MPGRGLSVGLLLWVATGCGDAPPVTGERPDASMAGAPTERGEDEESAPPGPTDREGIPPAMGCIRGGTTRDEVLALMGEPDSVAFGAWMYGRSEITFGYGAVLDYSNDGDNLPLCGG